MANLWLVVASSKMATKALVIGAQGVLGNFIAKGLSRASWEVTRAGRRPEQAADFRQLDLADPRSVTQGVRGFDIVVSTAHEPDLALERTILDQGGTLIDLIELSEPERAQLARVPTPKCLVVTDTGLGGVAYLAVAELLDAHSDADAAEYALMVSASGSTGRAGGLFAHKLLTSSRHHQTATVPFPEPFGTRRGLEVGQGTDGIPRTTINGIPISHYLCMLPRALHGMLLVLNSARLISVLPKASFTAGTRKVPDELSGERICEWVAVSSGGERVAAQVVEGEGYYRMTTAATVAFAEALARRQEKGLRSIDELVSLSELRPALEAEGIIVRKEATTDGSVR
jgi:NAD(P)-dependent dehydrogenase (short-subunit alcohol dehydrogenase family)